MRFRGTVCILILCLLPSILSARPYGLGPAGRTELFYQALSTGHFDVAEACVHPDDRNTLSIVTAVSQWYTAGKELSEALPILTESASRELKTTVLSWINTQGMPVYWYEPSTYAKVLLDLGAGRQFVFVTERIGQDWFVRLDQNALAFMAKTRNSGVDPTSLKTNGRRSPGFQAREFIRFLAGSDYSRAQQYVAKESRNLFSLLGLFKDAGQDMSRQEIKIIDESLSADDRARVELAIGTRKLNLDMVLQDGEWLVRFDN